LRASPDADNEELCRLVGGGDLAMHHPAGLKVKSPAIAVTFSRPSGPYSIVIVPRSM